MLFFFFFQAEDGIRDLYVTGVQTCALPISTSDGIKSGVNWTRRKVPPTSAARDRKSVVQGKSVDLGGRRIIKKKKNNTPTNTREISAPKRNIRDNVLGTRK